MMFDETNNPLTINQRLEFIGWQREGDRWHRVFRQEDGSFYIEYRLSFTKEDIHGFVGDMTFAKQKRERGQFHGKRKIED